MKTTFTSSEANPCNMAKSVGVGGRGHYLKPVIPPSSATTSWAGTSCGQSSWAYIGLMGLLIELMLMLQLMPLSHVGAGSGDDVWEITGGTCHLLQGISRIRHGLLEEKAGRGRGARRRRWSAEVLIQTFSWRGTHLRWRSGRGSEAI